MTHKHAELIAKFAEVAKITDQPHKQFQYLSRKHGGWRTFNKGNPKWNPDVAYRFKWETVVVNGVEVPRPLRYEELVLDNRYWLIVPTASSAMLAQPFDYSKLSHQEVWAYRGFVHSTRAEALEYAAALGWN